MLDSTKRMGFTIVELLIVVVVIAILASITVVSYNGIQERTRVAAISDGLKKIEKSMNLWMIDDGLTQWPDDPMSGGGVPFSTMIADNPTLKKYLQTVPSVPGINTDEWFYDNDHDIKPVCWDAYSGVNIGLRYMPSTALAQKVDDQIDDGDLNCGKVRLTGTGLLFYSLSYDENVMNY